MTEKHIVTTLEIAPDKVLKAAIDNLDIVIVIGVERDGKDYFASSTGDAKEMLWLVERFKTDLMKRCE